MRGIIKIKSFLKVEMIIKSILLILLISSFAFSQSKIRYLAIGDSYTIGESVDPADSFPIQLYGEIIASGYDIQYPLVIAKTGWTTNDLLTELNTNRPNGEFTFVTLLIGVNNQFRGGSIEIYREEFKALLRKAISYTSDPRNVIVLSIPDWGVTPFALDLRKDPAVIKKEIDQFNSLNEFESINLSVNYVNITDISREASNDLSLLAYDELHPSGKMYSLWVAKMIDTVKNIIDPDRLTNKKQKLTIQQNYILNQNYPNPFNPSTSISYFLPKDGRVTLTIYDILGNKVELLENGYKSAGSYSNTFNANAYTSGFYIYVLKAGTFIGSSKMLFLK